MKILVIKLGAIGDVIRTTSILHGLREKYPGCKIGWVTKKESFDVLKGNDLIDNLYLIGSHPKNEDYDLIISLDDDYEACQLASKLGPGKITGAYLENGQKAYTKDSSPWFDMGLISRFGKHKADGLKAGNKKTYQEIMHLILGLEYKKQEPVLVLDKISSQFGKNFANKNKIKDSDLVIGINTGAGGRWEDKKLSIEKTAELIDRLAKIQNPKLILFGGPEEKERNKKIKKLAKTGIIDAGCSNSLMEFASLVSLCKVLVTSDSLALHIATALKKKIVCFFGPTSAHEIELYGRGIKIIPKTGCLCCYKPKCDITPEYDVEEITNAVKRLTTK